MVDLFLDVGNDLDATTPCSDNSHLLAFKGKAFFVCSRVQQLALEIFQARQVRPLPVVEYAASVDEKFGCIFNKATG